MEKGIYICFEVWEGSKDPKAHGKYIGKTPIFEQAIGAVKESAKRGVICFLKGVRADGVKVYLI